MVYSKLISDGETGRMSNRQMRRLLVDRVNGYVMAIGGISTIVAVILIFFYLLYVVLPLFQSASIQIRDTLDFSQSTSQKTLLLSTEEYAELGMRLLENGEVQFFSLKDGKVVLSKLLAIGNAKITAINSGDPNQGVFVMGLDNGQSLMAKTSYSVSYPNDIRTITPLLVFPNGEAPTLIDPNAQPIKLITAQSKDDKSFILAVTADNRVLLQYVEATHSFLDDSITTETKASVLTGVNGEISHIELSNLQRDLYLTTSDGYIWYFDITNPQEPTLIDKKQATAQGASITALKFLAGGISIVIGDSQGQIAQWFPVRDVNNKFTLEHIRDFSLGNQPIVTIAPEYSRKGFAAVDRSGKLGIFHATAQRTLLKKGVTHSQPAAMSFSPNAKQLLILDQTQKMHLLQVDNPHPEISWQSLWGKVWYESRQQPEYIWQSSSASSEFEPKFSLTPLAFGTLKATFFAMLFAVPIAVMSAVYAGYFMSAKIRNIVKPTIEIMGAMPSVILGFLAGLWLAPLVERNLPGIFCIIFFTPMIVILSAYCWHLLPSSIRHKIPDGWEVIILIPVICLSLYVAMTLSQPIEEALFAGNMPAWITNTFGISYDQRNSLVVGIAMGFAVIPLIFSISEDAIFGVPKHLTQGSLALGATSWQTLVKVVLLTASPGIFSAIMIGLGRAVGETMIVLMSTGNTPIVDINMFQGFRALSANIAVEMPESELNSTHYRILFLAGLVLFLVTFIFNTIAELIRQHLRAKYSNL